MCLEMAVLKVKQHKKFNTALQQLFYHDTCIQPPPKLELQTKRRQTNKQTDEQMDRQTDRQTDK